MRLLSRELNSFQEEYVTDVQLSEQERKRHYMKEWRAANRERVKAYRREWVAKNAEHVAQYQQSYQAEYQKQADVQFETWMRNLRRNYGITPSDFNRMWDSQDGQCRICKVKLKPRGRTSDSVSVDHNHATGAVRALLCRQCNRAIGLMKDDPEILRAAALYLDEFGNYSTRKR